MMIKTFGQTSGQGLATGLLIREDSVNLSQDLTVGNYWVLDLFLNGICYYICLLSLDIFEIVFT